jgi:hypothetical protein
MLTYYDKREERRLIDKSSRFLKRYSHLGRIPLTVITIEKERRIVDCVYLNMSSVTWVLWIVGNNGECVTAVGAGDATVKQFRAHL